MVCQGRRAKKLSFFCAVLDDSTVKCWGSNAYGGLGPDNYESAGTKKNTMGDNLRALDLGKVCSDPS